MASRTCIVGGGSTGSGEHIFPASLGGLRVNKGIYCGNHNNAYGPLAAHLAEQLEFFNAHLGIRNTRTNQVRPAKLTDTITGEQYEYRGDSLTPTGPRILSKDGDSIAIGVTSMEEATAFLADQKAKGVEYRIAGPVVQETYIPGALHAGVGFGGPEGLRAVGYLAQTFFAHCFPTFARDPAMQPFVDYTLRGVGDDLVWWDFQAPTVTKNAFPFGHRIIVGVDADLGVAYARVSLFATLDFAMVFYRLTTPVSSQSAMNDIDPMAPKMPDDLRQAHVASAIAPVTAPADRGAGLAAAIGNGAARDRLMLLLKRAEDHKRGRDAEALLAKLNTASSLAEKETVLRDFWRDEPHRVLRLLEFGLTELRRQPPIPMTPLLLRALEEATERDPTGPTGVAPATQVALNDASTALTRAMLALAGNQALERFPARWKRIYTRIYGRNFGCLRG